MTAPALDLDAIEARANAVGHHRTGPGRCGCGYDAYKVGGFFPDYHAMLMNHLDHAPRAVTPANADDVLALVAALRDVQARLDNDTPRHSDVQGERMRRERDAARAQVAAVLAEWRVVVEPGLPCQCVGCRMGRAALDGAS